MGLMDIETSVVKNREVILVVDDQTINVELLSNALSDQYRVIGALSGVEALRLAEEQQPDLILLDIVMPGMSGQDVCRALKANPLTMRIPVIFVTGQDAIEDELEGLELGAVDYFRKPFAIPLIKARIYNQVELVRKTKMLEQMVWLDGLTGISNRRLFDKRIKEASRHCQRNKRCMCVILLDIDFFKQFNDHYGHTKGDDALRKVAKAIKESAARPMDLVARYGGEEFVILLADSDIKAGVMVAEKVRKAILGLKIPHAKSTCSDYLTVSLGLTTTAPDGGAFEPTELLKQADDCLYLAKSNGRNCAISSRFDPSKASL